MNLKRPWASRPHFQHWHPSDLAGGRTGSSSSRPQASAARQGGRDQNQDGLDLVAAPTTGILDLNAQWPARVQVLQLGPPGFPRGPPPSSLLQPPPLLPTPAKRVPTPHPFPLSHLLALPVLFPEPSRLGFQSPYSIPTCFQGLTHTSSAPRSIPGPLI